MAMTNAAMAAIRKQASRFRKQAGIPPVPKDVSQEQRQFFEAMRENLAVRMGQQGDKLEKAVTFRELRDIGVLSATPRGGPGSPGQPDYDFKPGGPEFDLSPPPAPMNLTATGGLDIIFLRWDEPNFGYNYIVEVWRSAVDLLDPDSPDMSQVGNTNGASLYVDRLNGDRTVFYYWVRYVKAIGGYRIPGPFNATAGTPGQIALDPSYIIELLNGKLGKTELAEELLTPINKIPQFETTLADHDSRLSSIKASVDDVLKIPLFDETLNYAIEDMARYNGYAWRALQAMTAPSPTPTEGEYWTQVGTYVTYDDVLSANAVNIQDNTSRISDAEGVLSSHSSSITALENSITTTNSNVSANSSAVSALGNRVTVAEGTISSQGEAITALQGTINDPETGVAANASAVDGLETRVTTAEGAISSQGQAITGLENTINHPESGVAANASAISGLGTRITTAEGAISSQGQAITGLQNTVNDPENGVAANASAVDGLETRVTTAEGSISSQSKSLQTLSSTVGDHSTAISKKAETTVVTDLAGRVKDIEAEYTVKLEVNGLVGGFGVANDGLTTTFGVSADQVFYVSPSRTGTKFNPDTNYSSIESLFATQFVFGYAKVGGVNRIAFNAPVAIPDATITGAKIAKATITQANIGALAVGSAQLADASITDAKIGGTIRSKQTSGGLPLWELNRNGELNMRSASGGLRIVGDRLEVYDGSTLRVRIGRL